MAVFIGKTLSVWPEFIDETGEKSSCLQIQINAPINVKPAGGGEAGHGGGDLTFLKNLPSNSLPTAKSFQSNATKFPCTLLSNIPRLDPSKAQLKYLQIKLYNLYFWTLCIRTILIHLSYFIQEKLNMLFITFWYFNYDCVVLFRCTSSHEYDIQRTFFQQIFERLNVKYKLFDSSFCVPHFHCFYARQRTRAAY